VLLVMAARVETLETRVRLTGWQAGFSHDLPMRRVVLGPLTGEDTVRLLRSLMSPDREDEKEETVRLKRFGGWLHDETGGQPFFLSEARPEGVGRVTTSGTRGSGDVTEVVLGVDTHLDFHVAVVLDPLGRRLGEIKVPTTAKGYGELLRWAEGFGPVRCVGVEGTGSYGALSSPAT
jgi:hypothetical protein